MPMSPCRFKEYRAILKPLTLKIGVRIHEVWSLATFSDQTNNEIRKFVLIDRHS